MKSFLKTVGATLVALLIFSVVAGIIAAMSIVGMVASSQSTRSIDKNSVLVLELKGVMEEQAADNVVNSLYGSQGLGLQEMLSAIRKAKTNDNIKGIYIEAGALGADMAQAQELRDALADFKKSRKWIIAYGEIYSTRSYYVASIADKVYLNPQGMVSWEGMGGRMVFLKDALQKVGIEPMAFKCGKYKSATEMFTETHMSEPSREQAERYVGGMWATVCQAVSRSRGISVDSLNAYADRVVTLEDASNLLRYKMIDGLRYADQVKDEVKERLGLDKDDEIAQVSVTDMQNAPEDNNGDEIAVYYAYGDIVDEMPAQSVFAQSHMIVGKDVCADLQELADDDDVKAVVLRVNSGGGSAYASEQIWHAVELLKAKKPVVVSMGGAAASGGYYMSCGANYIVAEPTTLTGSIGIFALLTDPTQLLTQKLGLSFDDVATNRNTLMGQPGKAMTAEQAGYLQASVNRGYTLFKTRVSLGRHLSMAEVEERAQGHVFLGNDALQLKLVDALGGLDVAVKKAAELAKLKEYYTLDYPEAPGLLDQLMNYQTAQGTALDEQMRLSLGSYYETIRLLAGLKAMNPVQARAPFIIIN